MIPNSSNRKNKFRKICHFFQSQKEIRRRTYIINNIFDILDDLQINLLLYT